MGQSLAIGRHHLAFPNACDQVDQSAFMASKRNNVRFAITPLSERPARLVEAIIPFLSGHAMTG